MLELNMYNLLTLVGAAVFKFIFGMIWYGPFFGTQWIATLKKTGAKIDMSKVGIALATTCVLGLFFSAVLLCLVISLGYTTFGQGALLGLCLWTGFMLPVHGNSILFEQRQRNFFYIGASDDLIISVLFGGIFAMLQA